LPVWLVTFSIQASYAGLRFYHYAFSRFIFDPAG
jgi:hypothetical protein